MVRLSAIAAVKEMTQGGAESVLECVASESAMATANSFAEPKATALPVPVGRSGMSACRTAVVTISIWIVYFCKTSPCEAVLPPPVLTFGELLADTVAGKLDASAVLDLTVDLDSVSREYAAMDSREAIKVMVCP